MLDVFFSISLCGFNSPATIANLTEADIGLIENVVQYELMDGFASVNGESLQISNADRALFYGARYPMRPKSFKFLPGERKLILQISGHVNAVINTSAGYTHFDLNEKQSVRWPAPCSVGVYFKDNIEVISKTNVAITGHKEFNKSRTHTVLNLLSRMADANFHRDKEGYRYDHTIKSFAAYIRMLAGCTAYITLQKNLELALPSLPTLNRFIRNQSINHYHHHISEGVVRSDELLQHLNDRKLPLIVSLSEDATRSVCRVQYDASTNQIDGFVLPTNSRTGLPIPFAYGARNASDIIEPFQRNTTISSFVNVIMAQPMRNVAPFCLLLYGTDCKYSANDVANRWEAITNELQAKGIHVMTISSDSDPKNNSAMRHLFQLGNPTIEYLFPSSVDWFVCAKRTKYSDAPIYCQDMTHIGTKLRNFLLRTIGNPTKLPLGKYFIDWSHLKSLIDNFTKDKHFFFLNRMFIGNQNLSIILW